MRAILPVLWVLGTFGEWTPAAVLEPRADRWLRPHAQRAFTKSAQDPVLWRHPYPALQAVLTRPIDWTLIEQQYDQIIRYATALRLGTAAAADILRRFTRANLQHPTYKALVELGKALRTSFV